MAVARGKSDSPIRLPRNVAKIARVVVAPNVHEFSVFNVFIVQLPPFKRGKSTEGMGRLSTTFSPACLFRRAGPSNLAPVFKLNHHELERREIVRAPMGGREGRWERRATVALITLSPISRSRFGQRSGDGGGAAAVPKNTVKARLRTQCSIWGK